jgi:Glycosyltransferase family 87
VAEIVGLGLIPLLSVPALTVLLLRQHQFAFDFSGWYWPAGQRLLHGLSPYVEPYPRALYYPAPGLIVFTPFSLIGRPIGDALFTAFAIASVPATLRVLGIRDWRLYGLVMLLEPVVVGWETANITLPLCLGVAVMWRFRDHRLIPGVTLGLLIAIKLFFWPLGFWLIATRRYAAAGWTAAFTLVFSAVGWAVVGFSEVPHYLNALHAFTLHAEWAHYGLASLLLHAGAEPAVAYLVMIMVGLAAAGACVYHGIQRRDRRAFSWSIVAALALSPVVETHYLAILLVPMLLAWPTFGPVWLVPLLLWTVPNLNPTLWECVVFCVVACYLVGISLAGRGSGQEPQAPNTATGRSPPVPA